MPAWVERIAWASLGVLAMTAGGLSGVAPLVGVGGAIIGSALVRRPGDVPAKKR